MLRMMSSPYPAPVPAHTVAGEVDAIRIDFQMRSHHMLEKDFKVFRNPSATLIGRGTGAFALGSYDEDRPLVELMQSLD